MFIFGESENYGIVPLIEEMEPYFLKDSGIQSGGEITKIANEKAQQQERQELMQKLTKLAQERSLKK